NRILLSEVLNGSQDESEIFLNPLSWYKENDIRLHAGVRVAEVYRASREVVGDNGVVEPYDRLVIATGSVPYIPPMEGLETADGRQKPGVFVFRNLDDCRKIASYAAGKQRAAVIGGGLLGLEAARGLQSFGLEVHVIHIGDYLMGQQLDAQGGA